MLWIYSGNLRPAVRARPRVLRAAAGLAGLLLLCSAGCGKTEAAKPPPQPPAVTVKLPVRKTVPVYGEYVGVVDSPETVELHVRVEGVLKEICFQEGSEVEKGALMFVLDPEPYEVALQKSKALLQCAEVALAQARNVKDIEIDKANVARDEAALTNAQQVARDARLAVAGQAMNRSQLDTAEASLKEAEAVLAGSRAKLAQSEPDFLTRVALAEANVAVAKAQVAQDQLNLGYTHIYSPVKGRVGMANYKIGALLGHNEPAPPLLATVSKVDPVYVHFTVSEREMFELRKLAGAQDGGGNTGGGRPVQMLLDDGQVYQSGGKPVEGRINFTDRALDPGTGTLQMRAEFPNPGHFLRPGNYAKIRVILAEKTDALLVSERALGQDQGGRFLLVVNDKNVLEQRPVKTGPRMDGLVVIEEGLKPDDRVVVKGLQRARPGHAVTPESEDGPAPPRTEGLTAATPGDSPTGPSQKQAR